MEINKLIRRIKENTKEYKGSHKFAFFNDGNNNLQIVCIISKGLEIDNSYVDRRFIAFNEDGEKTGYIHIAEDGKEVYLSEIYTFSKFRGLGIAKELNNILNMHLSKVSQEVLYGVYAPQQMSDDRRNNVYVSNKELEERASCFYINNGFEIVDINEFLRDPFICSDELYEKLNSLSRLKREQSIVYKKIDKDKKDFGYIEVCDNYYIKEGLNNGNLNNFIESLSRMNDKLKKKLLDLGWSENKVENFIRLNEEYDLLKIKDIRKLNLPKDIISKLKELTLNKKDLYEKIYNIYLELEERYIVIKR